MLIKSQYRVRPVPQVAAEDWSAPRIEHGRQLLAAVLREFPAGSGLLADLARWRIPGPLMHEIRAAARKVDVSWRSVMLANICYDLAMHAFGCSTAALMTPDGPVLARNLDWWPEAELIAAAECVQVGHVSRATFPGFSGAITGLSQRGFALALNAVGSSERARFLGQPVLLFLRTVLEEANDFEDAVSRVAHTPLAAPALITIVGTQAAERVVVERTPRRHALRWATGHAPLIATNDYRLLNASQEWTHSLYATACGRYDALLERIESWQPTTNVAILGCLCDPDVRQQITVQHVIARPASGSLHAWVPETAWKG